MCFPTRLACGNHSGEAERCPGSAKNCSASSRNRCSLSSRNAVRNHPEIAFSLPRILQPDGTMGLGHISRN